MHVTNYRNLYKLSCNVHKTIRERHTASANTEKNNQTMSTLTDGCLLLLLL